VYWGKFVIQQNLSFSAFVVDSCRAVGSVLVGSVLHDPFPHRCFSFFVVVVVVFFFFWFFFKSLLMLENDGIHGRFCNVATVLPGFEAAVNALLG